MSGNWIKMGVDLRTHPKVVQIAAALKADRLRVLGALYAAWCIFDAHAAEGTLHGYSPEALDCELGWKGFARAMAKVEWLEITGSGLHAPRFEEHNGTTAKRRALDASRKGRVRKLSASQADKSPQIERTETGQVSASKADKVRNREEKRREEPTNTTPATGSSIAREQPPAGAVPAEAGTARPIAQGLTLDQLRIGPAASSDEHARAGELFAVLKANACRGSPAHPQVVEWARAGLTVEQLRQAIGIARQAKPPEEPLNPAYLAPIVERVVSGKSGNGQASAWKSDEQAAMAKGRELGISPRAGEDWQAFRQRIASKLRDHAAEQVR